MKKTVIIFWAVLLFALILSGCSNEPKHQEKIEQNIDNNNLIEDELYQVLIYDYSDSVTSANHRIEYIFADQNKYSNQTISPSVELTIDKKFFSGNYRSSEYREYNYFPVNRYEGDNGITFELDESGMLTSCFWGNTSLADTPKSEKDCIEIAKRFLASIIDINDYEITIENNVERGLYTIEFSKNINGIKTTDTATIVVKNDGNLYSYSSFMLGRVNAETILTNTIDLDKVSKSIVNRLNQVYKNASKKYSRIEYSEPDILLTELKDRKVGLVCTVDVDCIEVLDEFEVVVSERINLVVMVD